MSKVVLEHVILGLRPYVLIELKPDPSGGDDPEYALTAAGGIETQYDMMMVLLLALSGVTGTPPEAIAASLVSPPESRE
jgi:hypothetical protein